MSQCTHIHTYIYIYICVILILCTTNGNIIIYWFLTVGENSAHIQVTRTSIGAPDHVLEWYIHIYMYIFISLYRFHCLLPKADDVDVHSHDGHPQLNQSRRAYRSRTQACRRSAVETELDVSNALRDSFELFKRSASETVNDLDLGENAKVVNPWRMLLDVTKPHPTYATRRYSHIIT